MSQRYFIYIITNKTNTTLYTGMTNNLIKRIWEHKQKKVNGFSKKYNLTKLVYYELFEAPIEAIQREKQIKAGSRKKKERLIYSINPEYNDLYASLL